MAPADGWMLRAVAGPLHIPWRVTSQHARRKSDMHCSSLSHPCFFQLDPSIFESLQKERVEAGDVIYIEANSGAVKVMSFLLGTEHCAWFVCHGRGAGCRRRVGAAWCRARGRTVVPLRIIKFLFLYLHSLTFS